MSYTCRLYLNSGFNSTNIPDSPSLLNDCSWLDVPALDVMTELLSSVRVKATRSQVREADYCRISDGTNSWYYSIDGISSQSLATDVQELYLIPDYILSAGGVSSLNIIDGVTQRVCVSDDTFGAYKEEDPFLTPAETPIVIYDSLNPTDYSSSNYDLVETTIDLIETATDDSAVVYTAKDENGTSLGEVTVPQTVSISSTTSYKIGDKDSSDFLAAPDIGTLVYNYLNSDVKEGVKRARGIVENPISKHVTIPGAFISVSSADNSDAEISTIWSKWWSLPPNNVGLDWTYATVKNNRVLYGSYNKYGIITAAANKVEYNPESIYNSETSHPLIDITSDPHLDGRPFYNFETIEGVNRFMTRYFFVGAAAGAQWANVPTIYTEKAGNALDTMNFNYDMENRAAAYSANQRSTAMNLANSVIPLASTAGTAAFDTAIGMQNVSLNNPLGFVTGIASLPNNFKNAVANQGIYTNNTLREAAQYLASTGAFMPEIAIPYNSSFLRDFYGNGCIIYRYRYTDNDIARLDKILTMYGYKHTKRLTKSDFTCRTHFNFVQSSISVTGLPKWMADGVSAQLSGGVRVWHELPNAAAYDDNPIA